ncbi:hypothetical protein Poli38472_013192 [Pythium oligandrum]|uniref:DUF547 domain-containing protein n=1 Tax=Pythium oligandrum TaxID=41045 RepID=A0A8K1C2K6_PYTOL|nr:hypothetical protein Poli38472_013192 [Pythium oligandrum]|eukprot:TMW55301.1 hypothetical protein Poli38472_013192 [Pythium oligandrum]
MSAQTGDPMHTSTLSSLVVAAVVVFAGIVLYLSPVLYPLIALGGVYTVMQTHRDPERSRIWTIVQIQLQQWKSATRTRESLNTEKEKASTESPATVVSSEPMQKPKRPSRVLRMPQNTSTASLRVTDCGVTSNGSPQELPESDHSLSDFIVEPNSQEPYEFENDFVKGKLLFLLQSPETHPLPSKYRELFEGKRRLFWIQLQLQFKKVPSGIMYIGGEVPRSMNLGFFTGGLTKIILSVLQSLVRGLHCSFGQIFPTAVPVRDQEELPHICFPLYTAVDQFVVTPPGGELPVLGSADFGESKEAMAARRKHGQPMYQYNTTDTYSFHFHSFFIDFAKWKLVGIPGMKESDLSVFWDDMPLRLCAYSLKPQPGVDPNSESDAKKASHSWRAKEYKFCFQMSHKIQKPLGIEDYGEDMEERQEFTASGRRMSGVLLEQKNIQQELSRYRFSVMTWIEYFSTSPAHSERRVGYVLHVQELDPNDGEPTRVKDEYLVLQTAVAAFAPLSFIERKLHQGRRGSRGGVFSSNKNRSLEESISVRSRSSRYAKVDDERQFLDQHLQNLANPEVETNATPDQELAAQSALLDLLQSKSTTSLSSEWPFLSSSFIRSNSFGSSTNIFSNTTNLPSAAALRDAPHAAVQIVRVLNGTLWRHEWVTMDKAQRLLRFFRMMASSTALTIPMDTILQVEEDNFTCHEPALDGQGDGESLLYWLHISTLERCHHLAFATRDERQQWMDSIRSEVEARGQDLLKQPIIQSTLSIEVEAYLNETVSKSRGTKRFVLNERCEFRLHAMRAFNTIHPEASTPNEIAARCLKLAIALQQRRLEGSSTRDLLGFLDAVCALRWVDLTPLYNDERARKAFLLNVYHLVLIHASLLGFLPRSKAQWGKFFNGMSCNIGGMYLSIAELEHGLIRAPTASLRIPIAFLVIPKIPDFDERAPLRLTEPDFRLNFAMNCLTKANANAIMVFTPEELEQQLEHITSLNVEHTMSYDRQSKIIYLPKLCEWYKGDFADESDSRAWNDATLRRLAPYLRGIKAQLFQYLVHQATDAHLVHKVKFAKYDYSFHDNLIEATLTD